MAIPATFLLGLLMFASPFLQPVQAQGTEMRQLLDVLIQQAQNQNASRHVAPGQLKAVLIKAYADTESQLVWQEYKQNVEWAWANNDPDRMEAVLDRYQSQKNTDVYHALRGWVHEKRGHLEQAVTSFDSVNGPFTEGEKKTLQKYKLLPLVYMDGSTFHQFYNGDPETRLDILKSFPDNRYARYRIGRWHWKQEQYERTSSIFSALREQFSPEDVLWDEIHLYRISSATRAGHREKALRWLKSYRSGPNFFDKPRAKQGFIDVEGTFTSGSPFGNYLDEWERVLEEDRMDWWYEQIGTASEPIRYMRLYSSLYENSSMAQLVTKAFRKETGCNLAVINHKGIRGGFDQGPITRNELYLALPWNNEMSCISVTPTTAIPEGKLERPVYHLFPGVPFQFVYPDPIMISGLTPNESTEGGKRMVVISNFLRSRVDAGPTVKSIKQTDRELFENFIRVRETVAVPAP